MPSSFTSLRPFQIALYVGFAVIGLLAIWLLTTFAPSADPGAEIYGERVVVWGTLDPRAMEEVFSLISETDKGFSAVEYVQVSADNFEGQLVTAIAQRRSPDLIILAHEQLVNLRPVLLPLAYEDGLTYSERSFRDTFIDGAEVFARPSGIVALPAAVDPLVLYWNRDLFAGNGIATAPTTWEGMVNSLVPLLTVRDTSRNILQSAVAFGEYRNVRHAKEVISMLLMQSGSRLVEEGDRGYVVALNESVGQGRPPLEATVQFYTDFSNANSPVYTWNRAQAEDRSSFIAGDLAMYFGYGSEAKLIQERNPNLNFDMAAVPQGAGATVRRTYGQFYGLAIPDGAVNEGGGFAAARTLTTPENAALLAAALNFAPVHRSTVAAGSSNAFEQVTYNSALIARGWLEPDPAATDAILQQMVEDVVSNRVRISGAVNDAIDRLILSY